MKNSEKKQTNNNQNKKKIICSVLKRNTVPLTLSNRHVEVQPSILYRVRYSYVFNVYYPKNLVTMFSFHFIIHLPVV